MTHERRFARRQRRPQAICFQSETDGCFWVTDGSGRRGPKSHSIPKAFYRWLVGGFVKDKNEPTR